MVVLQAMAILPGTYGGRYEKLPVVHQSILIGLPGSEHIDTYTLMRLSRRVYSFSTDLSFVLHILLQAISYSGMFLFYYESNIKRISSKGNVCIVAIPIRTDN
jgi:hypothetical protein